MANLKKLKRKYTKRSSHWNKFGGKGKRGRKPLGIPLEENIPFPTRGDSAEMYELRKQISYSVPKMRVKKHSFIVDTSKATSIRKFLRTEYPKMAFRGSPVKDNKKVTRFWRWK